VRNLGYWNVECDQAWGLDWHRNEGIELTFLERGRLKFAVDDGEYQLEAGDLTFTRPWQLHRIGSPNITPSCLHWLILDVGVRQPHQDWRWPSWLVLTKADLDELTMMLRQAVDAIWHAKGDVLQCFQRIAAAVDRDQSGSNASRLAAYLNELFVLLLDTLRQGGISFDQSLASTRRTVELFWKNLERNTENLAYPWTVREMAKWCGMGATQFALHCKGLTNVPPMEYLNWRRVEAASDALLAEPQKTVTNVALEHGFSSSQYFAQVFRRIKGISPTEYRQRRSV